MYCCGRMEERNTALVKHLFYFQISKKIFNLIYPGVM